MGFVRVEATHHKAAVMGIIFLLLLGALLFPPTATTEAAPNPIPIVSVSLSPSEQKAHVTHNASDEVKFEGVLMVDQPQFMTSTTTLTASIDNDWTVYLSPATVASSGTRVTHFTVTVTVPGGTSPDVNGTLVVTASCKVPILAPILASTSAMVTVDLDNSGNIWTVRILEPPEGGLVMKNTVRVRGTASYSGGAVNRVDVRFCDGLWRNRTISVMAHSGKVTSPVVLVNVTLDRPDTAPAGDGDGTKDELETSDDWGLLPIILLILIAFVGVAVVYHYYIRTTAKPLY